MFSTSERSTRNRTAAALVLRQAIDAKQIRVYNPRNKMAAAFESPVSHLLGLISYLIDPITYELVGKTRRPVMVSASMQDPSRRGFARSLSPPFAINDAHLEYQKKFIKADGGDIGHPAPNRAPVLGLVDSIRASLASASQAGRKPRLTLAGFISRLLSLPFFRNCGFTPSLFRQALFTTLLEANIAPTRLSSQSLDQPLEVSQQNSKFVWPDRYWQFLGVFGSYLNSAPMDDPEVETFEEDAVLLLTFHQGKGLEFDHVYLAGTGREPDIAPALRTMLFSGETPKYQVDGTLTTKDKKVLDLALADREREVYVAMTRAKAQLTVLHDPNDQFAYMPLNQAIASLFDGRPGCAHPHAVGVTVKDYVP
jgi:DNA helicase-2/ATP-dependent DNA helicase PcrA